MTKQSNENPAVESLFTPRRSVQAVIAMLVLVLLVGLSRSASAQELQKEASWQFPAPGLVNDWVDEWIAAANVDATEAEDIRQVLANNPRPSLATTVQIVRQLFPQCRSIVQALQAPPLDSNAWQQLMGPAVFEMESVPASALVQLRLAAGCWFARHQRYDDALELLSPLAAEATIAPDRLLFYRGLAHHRLLQSDACLKSLRQLMENETLIPRRFEAISRLMIADMQSFEKDSLDEIARLMQDVRRRQALHRSGQRVIQQEKKVLEKLDQMIEEMEKKMQQQQASSSAQPAKSSGQPMQESENAGGRGSGDVAEKTTEEGGDWGSLPPQKREAALAEMAKDMPPHYREVIEEYFRQLAREPGKDR